MSGLMASSRYPSILVPGCPEGVESSGWRYQDNSRNTAKKNKNDNENLRSECTGEWKLWYCTKPGTSDDLGIKWPAGSYCLGRKEGTCPDGFEDGYIRWTDPAEI